MEEYIYHVHTMYQRTSTEIEHFDGLLTSGFMIVDEESYVKTKKTLAKRMNVPEENCRSIIIASLSFIHKKIPSST